MQSKVPSKQGNIIFSSQIVQQSTILTTVSNDNNFALFGFNHDLQQIQESVINITVGFNLYNGALICYQCDVQISNSVAVFIASGQFLSGLVFNSLLSIQLQNTTIQYRFQSQYSAGLAFNVSQDIETFILKSVTILGFNSIFTNQRLFVSQLNQQINITILQVQVCQNTTMSDTEIRYIILSNPVIYQCKSICEQNTYYVYGICATQTVNSEFMVSNGTFICIENALFDGQQCVCQENYVLNGSLCVSILLSLTNIYRRVDALTNVETDINSIYQLINDFNNSVVSELNSIAQNTLTMYNQSEAHLVNNISALNQKLNNNNDDLDQRIFSNVSALHQSIVQNSADMQQQINTTTQQLSNAISNTNNLINVSTNNLNKSLADINQSLSQNISQVNVNMLNVQGSLQTYILQNFTTLDQRLAFNITQKDIQIQQLTDSLAFVTSIVMNTVEQELWFECQQQLYTFKVFDLATATNAIQSSDFASGFAFDTQVIQNAFLDVQSISSSFTLFKTQSVFLNIKVQLNGVSFVSGAMLSPSQSIQINQLAVVSKVGTQVTINAGVVLSILQQTATVTNITNLLLNINMNPSSAGIISLINVVNGQLIVKGYQILGSYSSTNTISLGVCQIQGNSKVNLNYIQISPDLFMCGNLSSYLISYVNSSTMQINHISIYIGNLSSKNSISSITVTQANYFTFGGLVTYQNTTQTQIQDITLHLNIQWQLLYIYFSGQLLGYSNNSDSTIKRICSTDTLIADQNTQFMMFGLIGLYNGKLQIQQLQANHNYTNGLYNITGIVGHVNGSQTNIIQVNIIMNISANLGDTICKASTMIACIESITWVIKYISIHNSIISGVKVGLISGQAQYNGTISNIQLIQCILAANGTINHAYSGAIIGYIYIQSSIQVLNAITTQHNITVTSDKLATLAGCQIGESGPNATYIVQNSKVNQCQLISISNTTWNAYTGGIISKIYSNGKIINVNLENINHFGHSKLITRMGGIVGYMTELSNASLLIQNSYISSMNINASSYQTTYAAGIIGQSIYTEISINITNINNITLNVQGTQYARKTLYVVISSGTYQVNNVTASGTNIINGASITYCALTNISSENGC
ncbi:Hypothetical_protein [Hexamita inflata]|uniref:Hypothetical_protein n=1 Tax=Hexamita inflata TaxID=28002 RepID=A0AA86QV89_9EUKA|nr:Hypothetical protein HINF_LOCUS49781 [Hexamita inflata]